MVSCRVTRAWTREQLDLKASEALAQKIQDDLDKMGPQYTTILPAERKKELDEIAKNLTAEQWENLAEQAASKPNLGKSELGVDNPDFVQLMVERGRLLRQQEAEIKAKHQKERPWTKNEIKKYMRNFVKNQGCSMFGSGWTQKRVWGNNGRTWLNRLLPSPIWVNLSLVLIIQILFS